MSGVLIKHVAVLLVGISLAAAPTLSVAQSGGGGGGGGGGSSGGGSAGGAGGSAGGGAGSSAAGGSTAGGASTGPSAGGSAGDAGNNSSGLTNQAPRTTTPGISTPAQDRTRQRAMELRNSNAPSASVPEAGDDRGRTNDVRRDAGRDPDAPGLPRRADDDRRNPNELSAGGGARQGAAGKTMAECEAAWDPETHMSKETWHDTCRRTMTGPHL